MMHLKAEIDSIATQLETLDLHPEHPIQGAWRTFLHLAAIADNPLYTSRHSVYTATSPEQQAVQNLDDMLADTTINSVSGLREAITDLKHNIVPVPDKAPSPTPRIF